MKNPVTFSISEARKVQKKRQIRQIILLSAIVFLLLGAVLVIQVLTMKQEADQLFPSESASALISPAMTAESSGTAESSSVQETTAPAATPTQTEASDGTSASDASSGTGTATPTPPASTAAVSPAPEMNVYIPDSKALQTTTHKVRDSAFHQLQKSVQALIDQQTGVRCGFYYINLKNGEEFGYNDTDPFVVGSAVNLPINIMLYDQIKTGGVSLSELMAYDAADTVIGTGTIQNTVIGSQHYIRELTGLSITASDNTATAMLLRRLGGIDIVNNSMKLISDVVDFRTITTYTDYAQVQQSGMNRMSAQDLAKYMEYFYKNYIAYPDNYQPLFNDLAHTSSDWGVAGSLSPDILVCHKTGSYSAYNAETDVALVFAEEPYVLCVSVECADPAAGRLLQQQLGDLVYAYLHGCYS